MEGGFGNALQFGKPSAGKTGTTNDGRSVWFVGYTPKLAAAAMIAGANGEGQWLELEGQVIGGQPVYSASGSGFAGPVWGDAMAAVSGKLAYEDFQSPAGDEIAGVLTTVPDVTGQSVEAATQALQGVGLAATNGGQVNSTTGAGLVASTSPGAGTSLSSGDTVTLYTSTGTVPPPPTSDEGGNGGNGNKGRGRGRGGRGNR